MTLHDEEAERIVLGSLLQNYELIFDLGEQIKADDFFIEAHRDIYRAILNQHDENQRVDAGVVIAELKQMNLLEKVGNRSYILDLAESASPMSAHVYAKTVRELSLRRILLSELRELDTKIQDHAVSLEEVLGGTELSVQKVTERYSAYNVRHVRETKGEFAEFIEHIRKTKDGISGTASGFKELDELTSGFKGGQLIILAARPGVGKTTFALNIAQNVAYKNHLPVLVFSLEMQRLELVLRLICADQFLESGKIQKGFINEKEIKRLMEGANKLYRSDFYIDDSTDLSTWEFKQRSRRLTSQLKSEGKKIGLIVVDYLQLMSEKNLRYESRQAEVANFSRSLKLIAKSLDVPVLALSQMNRSVEQRGKDPHPQLSDLRESGAIEQDADIVMFLHEPKSDPDNPDDMNQGLMELIVAKHRAGATKDITLSFKKEMNKFIDYQQAPMPESSPSPYGI